MDTPVDLDFSRVVQRRLLSIGADVKHATGAPFRVAYVGLPVCLGLPMIGLRRGGASRRNRRDRRGARRRKSIR
jgi:hypothetical protein